MTSKIWLEIYLQKTNHQSDPCTRRLFVKKKQITSPPNTKCETLYAIESDRHCTCTFAVTFAASGVRPSRTYQSARGYMMYEQKSRCIQCACQFFIYHSKTQTKSKWVTHLIDFIQRWLLLQQSTVLLMLINDKHHCSASRTCLFMRLDVRGTVGLGGSDMVQSSWCRRCLMLKQTLCLRRNCLEIKYIGAFWCLCIVLHVSLATWRVVSWKNGRLGGVGWFYNQLTLFLFLFLRPIT